jgi:hypothetical protein
MHRYESTEVDGSIVRPKQIQMQFQTRRQVPKVKAPPKGKRVCARVFQGFNPNHQKIGTLLSWMVFVWQSSRSAG